MEETNVTEVTSTVVEASSNGKKSGLVIGIVAVATLGVAYATAKVIAKIRKRKASKKAEEVKETVEE